MDERCRRCRCVWRNVHAGADTVQRHDTADVQQRRPVGQRCRDRQYLRRHLHAGGLPGAMQRCFASDLQRSRNMAEHKSLPVRVQRGGLHRRVRPGELAVLQREHRGVRRGRQLERLRSHRSDVRLDGAVEHHPVRSRVQRQLGRLFDELWRGELRGDRQPRGLWMSLTAKSGPPGLRRRPIDAPALPVQRLHELMSW